MANTFSQIHIQAVFAVAMRQCLIKPDFKEELQKYITGIIRKERQKTHRDKLLAGSRSSVDRPEAQHSAL